MNGITRAVQRQTLKRVPMSASALLWTVALACLPGKILAVDYYVSPTGSDTNSGTDLNHPWQSVSKVDTTLFSPGDQILFQRGGNWHDSLSASASGTTTAPITYGAYGDAAAPKPTFWGSDPLSGSAFSAVSGLSNTYAISTPAIHWVFEDGSFTHNSTVALRTAGGTYGDVTTNLNYVSTTPNSWFYDNAASKLYFNPGTGSPADHALTGVVRDAVVNNNNKSNLIFRDIAAAETAWDNEGYAFSIQNSSNVQVLGCDATKAGKHHFGIINSTGFLGKNLYASQSFPDCWFGGASGYVSFSDNYRHGDSYTWENCVWDTPNGAYAALISHGAPDAIGSLTIKNMSGSGYGAGIDVQTTGPNEKVIIQGGNFSNDATIGVSTDNAIIDGVTLSARASIGISGSHTVVQNCLVTGAYGHPWGGRNGGIVDNGQDNTIRFNTIILPGEGPAIGIMRADSNTHIYGNVIDGDNAIGLIFDASGAQVDGGGNLFSSTAFFTKGWNLSRLTLAQWQALGYDSGSLLCNPNFTDPVHGDYSLKPGCSAIDLLSSLPAGAMPIYTDYNGNPRLVGVAYDAGAIESVPEPTSLALITLAATGLLIHRRKPRRASSLRTY